MLANVTYIIPHQDLYADEILSAAAVINHTTGDARDWTSSVHLYIQLAGRVRCAGLIFSTLWEPSRDFPAAPFMHVRTFHTSRNSLLALPFRFIHI
jgi:hypothetical protein